MVLKLWHAIGALAMAQAGRNDSRAAAGRTKSEARATRASAAGDIELCRVGVERLLSRGRVMASAGCASVEERSDMTVRDLLCGCRHRRQYHKSSRCPYAQGDHARTDSESCTCHGTEQVESAVLDMAGDLRFCRGE